MTNPCAAHLQANGTSGLGFPSRREWIQSMSRAAFPNQRKQKLRNESATFTDLDMRTKYDR